MKMNEVKQHDGQQVLARIEEVVRIELSGTEGAATRVALLICRCIVWVGSMALGMLIIIAAAL